MPDEKREYYVHQSGYRQFQIRVRQMPAGPDQLFAQMANMEEADCRRAALALNLHGELVEALKVADVHIGWTDCTLQNVHDRIRSLLAKLEERTYERE